MAIKYYLEYTTKNVKPDNTSDIMTHRAEIYDDNYTDDAIQIYGNIILTKAEANNTLDVIRGGGLTLDLEANTDLNFDDLYTEDERTFQVKYYQNGNIHSLYWLSPEGLFQSFVEDKWIISLDCTDGLGFLANLSYVENDTGLPFTGKQSMLEIIVNCLKRTNLEQDIYIRTDFWYNGLGFFNDITPNAKLNSERFIKDDEDTYMQCDEVLTSVLDLLVACITQKDGAWHIYKPNDIYDDSEFYFYHYDSDGVAQSPTRVTKDIALNLGSRVDGYYPHHVNANQKITVDSSIGAYRINYKYGFVKGLIDNKYLYSNSDTDIPFFNIISGTYLSFPTDRAGIILDSVDTVYSVLELDNQLDLVEGATLDVSFSMYTDVQGNFLQFKVILTGTTTTYYLNNTGVLISGEGVYDGTFQGEWLTTDTMNQYSSYFTDVEIPKNGSITIKTPELPEDGDLNIIIYTAKNLLTASSGTIDINEVSLTPYFGESNLKGENFTFTRIAKPSTKIAEVKEIYNGDSISDVYVGTIYEVDGTTPTETWNRDYENGSTTSRDVPLLQLMGEEVMKMFARPTKVFSGDVFGYVDYLSRFTINNVSGIYMATQYSYDTKANVTTLKLKEILNEVLNDENYDDIETEVAFDYGNVVEPTIK